MINVNTIEQFKILDYIKENFVLDNVKLFLIDRYTIKLIDIDNKECYFKYNSGLKSIEMFDFIK